MHSGNQPVLKKIRQIRPIRQIKKTYAMPTRRHFLATGLAALPRLSHAAPTARPSLGFSLYGMKSLPLSTALKTCAEIGYTHVELALNEGYPTEPGVFSAAQRQATVAQLAQHRLGLPCLMINISLTSDDKAHTKALQTIAAAGQMAHDLNATTPPVLETVVGGKPATWDEQKAGMAARLADWATAAEKAKVVLTIKAHIGSAMNSPERVLWMLDQVKSPAIQVAYDYSHFELQGIDMEHSMKLLLPRTKFIHVKDGKLLDGGKFQFLLPGEGSTDYVKYFSLLKQHSYTGPVCVEVSGQIFNKPGYDPMAAAKSSFVVLNSALQKS
jgi:sugar phosphate isomerase/epimerase